MEKLKLYIVKKASSDNTFKCGDLIWLSENGDLNSVSAGGWLSKNEWDVNGTNDFEYEISKEYFLDIHNGVESVRELNKVKRMIENQLIGGD